MRANSMVNKIKIMKPNEKNKSEQRGNKSLEKVKKKGLWRVKENWKQLGRKRSVKK